MRLIDADKLRKHERDVKDGDATWLMDVYLPEEIENAPTVEECEDCISREKAEETTWFDPTYIDPLNVLAEVRDRLRSLPPVIPTVDWIRISKKTLPEDEIRVLTTIHARRRTVVRSGLFYHGMFHNDNGDSWKWNDKHILAWKPLPKPFKPQESEG